MEIVLMDDEDQVLMNDCEMNNLNVVVQEEADQLMVDYYVVVLVEH
jgi:hypothetical protein